MTLDVPTLLGQLTLAEKASLCLGSALHIVAVTRMTHDPETRAYVERRRSEGRTTKEIRRILKRYLARQIFRTLAAAHAQPAT